MALPVEVYDFFQIMKAIWLAFPLMVRQVFYISLCVMGVLGVMKAMH